jgi:glycosyltransferase involved in cell wall biosynthesis
MQETLLILTPGFPVDETDTTCLPLQQSLIRVLHEMYPQLDIHVVSLDYPYRKEPYRWHDLHITSFGSKRRGPLFNMLRHHKINKRLRSIASEKKLIGILSFWCTGPALAGKKLAAKTNIPHYCWIPGRDAEKKNKYIRSVRPDANELIALSDFIADEFEKNHGIRPAHLVTPGIDPRSFARHDAVKDIDLLAVGSLIPLKRYSVFLNVVAALKKQLPGIKAVLAGKGPEKERLEALIRQYGLENNITLTGELPHPEALQLMQRAKVFLHPSSYEGFGVVCLEALYSRARVISFCRPMKMEIKNWHIVSSEQEMIATTLQLLVQHPVQEPVAPFLISHTASAMMRLFNYKEATTC